jgi:hypothetical protein
MPEKAAYTPGMQVPPEYRPEKAAYTPGMQVPPEYRVVQDTRLLVTGAALFGVSYLPMAIFGIHAMATTDDHSGAFFLIPVFPPLLLPFAPLGQSPGFGFVRTAFLVDGILQVGGIGLLIAGAVTSGKYLKRKDIAALMPSVSVGSRSVGFQWSF